MLARRAHCGRAAGGHFQGNVRYCSRAFGGLSWSRMRRQGGGVVHAGTRVKVAAAAAWESGVERAKEAAAAVLDRRCSIGACRSFHLSDSCCGRCHVTVPKAPKSTQKPPKAHKGSPPGHGLVCLLALGTDGGPPALYPHSQASLTMPFIACPAQAADPARLSRLVCCCLPLAWLSVTSHTACPHSESHRARRFRTATAGHRCTGPPSA